MAYKFVNADQLDADLTTVADAIRTKGGTSEQLAFPTEMVLAISAISTGVELNYDVVGGTTAPSNPKENTIWVNTSTAITSHVFSATQPTGSAGMVWIETGTTSPVEFNALKKNGIQVYPISAKQYVSGAWVKKTAESYQNGEWVCWIHYLYNEGKEIAGGIKGYAYGSSGTGATRVTPSVTKGADTITIAVNKNNTSNSGCSTLFAEDPVDLTNFNTMKINVTSRSGGNETIYVGITKNKKDQFELVAYTVITETGTFSLNLSSYNGEYYCIVGFSGAGNKTLAFNSWTLET